MKTYDFIFAGGGLAGLSLACHIARSPLRGCNMLIVDQDAKHHDDRTFSFWSDQPGPFDRAISSAWQQLAFHAPGFERTSSLGSYRYQSIRGIDFYRLAHQELSTCPNVEFRHGRISRLEDGFAGVFLTLDGQVFSGKWAFDSRARPPELGQGSHRYHTLKLAFRGWDVETAQQVCDPSTPILMDFRTTQHNDVRFFYVLPFSERRALVEYTLFTNQRISTQACQVALRNYLRLAFGLEIGEDCRARPREGGNLPLTDQPFARRLGRHVLAIGVRGGRLKPTTGYGFTRIQRDSQAILDSLLRNSHPFDLPNDAGLYSRLDAMMLEVMARHPGRIPTIFTALFKKNPIERTFRFLDEDASLGEIAQLIATLPPGIFLRILARRRTPAQSSCR